MNLKSHLFLEKPVLTRQLLYRRNDAFNKAACKANFNFLLNTTISLFMLNISVIYRENEASWVKPVPPFQLFQQLSPNNL